MWTKVVAGVLGPSTVVYLFQIQNGIEWENLLFWYRDEKGLANSHLLPVNTPSRVSEKEKATTYRRWRQQRLPRRWCLPLQSDTFSSNGKWLHINFPRYGFLFFRYFNKSYRKKWVKNQIHINWTKYEV